MAGRAQEHLSAAVLAMNESVTRDVGFRFGVPRVVMVALDSCESDVIVFTI